MSLWKRLMGMEDPGEVYVDPIVIAVGKTPPKVAIAQAELRKRQEEVRRRLKAEGKLCLAGYQLPTEGLGADVQKVWREHGWLTAEEVRARKAKEVVANARRTAPRLLARAG